MRSDPWCRVIETSSLRPILASQAPNVRRIIAKKIEGLDEKNGNIMTNASTRPSSSKSAISMCVRCSASVIMINRINRGSKVIGVKENIELWEKSSLSPIYKIGAV